MFFMVSHGNNWEEDEENDFPDTEFMVLVNEIINETTGQYILVNLDATYPY